MSAHTQEHPPAHSIVVTQFVLSRYRLNDDVRHTYATLSLDSGVEPKILSDRVGHSNPTVTFQIYAHRSTGRDREAAELIGQLISAALGGPVGTAPEAC